MYLLYVLFLIPILSCTTSQGTSSATVWREESGKTRRWSPVKRVMSCRNYAAAPLTTCRSPRVTWWATARHRAPSRPGHEAQVRGGGGGGDVVWVRGTGSNSIAAVVIIW